MNICFLDGADFPYTSKDIDSNKIRGGESIIINLSRELTKLEMSLLSIIIVIRTTSLME